MESTTTIAKYPNCNCEECPLKDEKRFIPPNGPEDSKILFIGQAGAYYESLTKIPFSGPSGKALDQTLEVHGLRREDVRADNSILCYWPAGEGDPPEAAIKACNGHVKEAVDRAEIIIPMGNAALSAIYATRDQRYRGSGVMAMSNRLLPFEDKWVLPLLHPAFYLRQTEEGKQGAELFRNFIEGIGLIKRILDGEYIPRAEDVKVKVFDDPTECIEFLNSLETDQLGVDLETDYPDPVKGLISSICLSPSETEAYIIPWSEAYLQMHGHADEEKSWSQDNLPPLLEYQEVYDALKGCLERQDHVLMHNAPFDARLLRREGIEVRVEHDTLLLHYILDERSTAQSLKLITRLLFGVADWEEELSKYVKKGEPYTLIPPHVLFPYQGLDACFTVSIKRVLWQELNKPENEGPYRAYVNILQPCSDMFLDLAMQGVKMDVPALAKALNEMPKILDDLEKEMCIMIGDRFYNPRSPKQTAEVLFDKLKLPMIKGRSTAQAVIEALGGYEEDPMHPFVGLLAEYRQYHKICGTYMESFGRAIYRGRGYPDIKLFGTVTGRLSANKLNPMVMPRESRGDLYQSVKDIFIADDDCFLFSSDYSGAELRCLAVLAEDEWLKSELNDPNVDFHSIMAREIFGEDFINANPDRKKELRVIAKMLVFGLNYGRGARSIALQLRCSIAEAQSLVDRYFAPMPGVSRWRKQMERDAVMNEYLETPIGRRRRFPLITKDNVYDIYKQAVNAPVQSVSNDVNLMCMLNTHKTLSPTVRPLWPVHDSVLFNVKKSISPDEVAELVRIIRETPKELLDTDVEFYNDMHIGHSWGSLQHVESAEEIFDYVTANQ
jgi:DNA polymerase I